ncbi:hypothetical protein LXL04_015958, partial [Taraxacum kok-saghyz]
MGAYASINPTKFITDPILGLPFVYLSLEIDLESKVRSALKYIVKVGSGLKLSFKVSSGLKQILK